MTTCPLPSLNKHRNAPQQAQTSSAASRRPPNARRVHAVRAAKQMPKAVVQRHSPGARYIRCSDRTGLRLAAAVSPVRKWRKSCVGWLRGEGCEQSIHRAVSWMSIRERGLMIRATCDFTQCRMLDSSVWLRTEAGLGLFDTTSRGLPVTRRGTREALTWSGCQVRDACQ